MLPASLSLACGLMIGRDLQHKTHPIITLIGDGALSGGEAYEALNHLATMSSQCLIIINDNDQLLRKITAVCTAIFNNCAKLMVKA